MCKSEENNNNMNTNNNNQSNMTMPMNFVKNIPGFMPQYPQNYLQQLNKTLDNSAGFMGGVPNQMMNYPIVDAMNKTSNQYFNNVSMNTNVNSINRNNLFQLNPNFERRGNKNNTQRYNKNGNNGNNNGPVSGFFNPSKTFNKFQNKPKSTKSDQSLNYNLQNLQNKLMRTAEEKECNKLEKIDNRGCDKFDRLNSFIKQHSEVLNTTDISDDRRDSSSLMVVKVKTQDGIKEIQISKSDNVLAVATAFCKEHDIDEKFINPICQMINKALTSLQDILFNNDMVDSDIDTLSQVIEKYNTRVGEDSQSTNDDECFTNISCFTSMDDHRRDDNDDEILNKTL
jgi:hypothetical protein